MTQHENRSDLPCFRSKSNSKIDKDIITPTISPNDRAFENKTIKSQNYQDALFKDKISILSEGNCNPKNSTISFDNYILKRDIKKDKTPKASKYKYYDKDINSITDYDEASKNDSNSKDYSLFDESYKLIKKEDQAVYYELIENDDAQINIEDFTKNEIEKITFPKYTIETLRSNKSDIGNNKDVEDNSAQKDVTEIDFLTGYGKSQKLYDSSSEDMLKFNQLRPNFGGCLQKGKYITSLANMVEIQDVESTPSQSNQSNYDEIIQYTNSQEIVEYTNSQEISDSSRDDK